MKYYRIVSDAGFMSDFRTAAAKSGCLFTAKALGPDARFLRFLDFSEVRMLCPVNCRRFPPTALANIGVELVWDDE